MTSIPATKILLEWLLPGSNNRWIVQDASDARALCRGGIVIIAATSFTFLHSSLFTILGISEHLHRLILILAGIVSALLTLVVIWQSGSRVSRLWLENSLIRRSSTTAIWVNSWHMPAMLPVVLMSSLWITNTIIGREEGSSAAFNVLSIALATMVVRMIIDLLEKQWFPRGVDAEATEFRSTRFRTPRVGVAVISLILVVAFLAESLGAGTYGFIASDRGTLVLKSAFSITASLVIAWVLWEMIKSFIDKHLPEDAMDTTLEFDGEGGEGAPASRAETLLPLLRGFLLFVVMVIAALMVLSSMGVNIAPLLAGAGVVGLAVGFGAQKLVQDVISGIFFLVDDAFRTGEHIETAEMRGTVENISIRSIRLRHHLGPVQTIPYSEMATVKNHSRDYIIMKLPFRLPYDFDIEKVRKINKKIGQEMLKDEELGPGFLAPLKSQGVLQMEDSAMVMRMKFTAKPGEQWVIRREAYRRVRDALRAEGIEFAHRQVTVHIPEQSQASPEQLRQAAAAVAEEESADKKGPSTDIR